MSWTIVIPCFSFLFAMLPIRTALFGAQQVISLKDVDKYTKIENLVLRANQEKGPENGVAHPTSYQTTLINATKQVVAGSLYRINYFLVKSDCTGNLVVLFYIFFIIIVTHCNITFNTYYHLNRYLAN